MSLSHFRPCQEAPLNSGAFFEEPIHTAAGHGSWAQHSKNTLHSTGSQERYSLLCVQPGTRPKGKETGKVIKGLQSCSLPVPSDRISASSPRVVGDARARALCADMKRCSYYETCATYGLNVDRVFQEGECGDPCTCGKQGARGLGYS